MNRYNVILILILGCFFVTDNIAYACIPIAIDIGNSDYYDGYNDIHYFYDRAINPLYRDLYAYVLGTDPVAASDWFWSRERGLYNQSCVENEYDSTLYHLYSYNDYLHDYNWPGVYDFHVTAENAYGGEDTSNGHYCIIKLGATYNQYIAYGTGTNLNYTIAPNDEEWLYLSKSIYIYPADNPEVTAYESMIEGCEGTVEWDGKGNCDWPYAGNYLPTGVYKVGLWLVVYGDLDFYYDVGELRVCNVDLDTDINGDGIFNEDDPEETEPGGYIAVGGARKRINLNLVPFLEYYYGYYLYLLDEGYVTLKIVEGGVKADIYAESTGGTPDEDDYVCWNLYYEYARNDLKYYMENGIYIQATNASTTPHDIHIQLSFFDPACNEIHSDWVFFTAYQVTDVQWEKFDNNWDLGTDSEGITIFPDHKYYNDPNTDRNRIRVIATITPPLDNKNVYFTWKDVDDPCGNAIDTKPVEHPNTGPDNFGTGADLLSTQANTDGTGKARVDFKVSKQPGDNFKIAAAAAQNQLSLVNQNNIESNDPNIWPPGVYCSPTLTVWRHLWIERDSMKPVTSAGYVISENFSSGQPGSPTWTYYSDSQGQINVTNGRLRLDDSVADYTYSLNEAVLHFNHTGMTNAILILDHYNLADEPNSMLASFTGHNNCDGIALSVDGNHWRKVTDLTSSFSHQSFNLNNAISLAKSDAGSTDVNNVQIKFQQYDNTYAPNDGREFDNILLIVYNSEKNFVCRSGCCRDGNCWYAFVFKEKEIQKS
jgi:hypothetical protein